MKLLDGFTQAISKSNMCNFSGRARRAEFAGFMLVFYTLYFGTMLVTLFLQDSVEPENIHWLESLVKAINYAFMLPFFGVTCRRLHDLGYSGWWNLPIQAAEIALVLYSFIPYWAAETEAEQEIVALSLRFWVGIVLLFAIFMIKNAILAGKEGQQYRNKYGESPKAVKTDTK